MCPCVARQRNARLTSSQVRLSFYSQQRMYHLLMDLGMIRPHFSRPSRNANNSTSQEERVFRITIGLDGAGKTVRTPISSARCFSQSLSCPHHPLHTAGKIALPSAMLQFWDLGGQRGIRSIWPKYYDDRHAVVNSTSLMQSATSASARA